MHRHVFANGFTRLILVILLMHYITLVSASDLVVFQAHGINLKVGQMINGTLPLTLQTGQKIVLIAPNGKIYRLQGPYNEPPIQEGNNVETGIIDTLKSLITPQQVDTGTLGITRDATNIIRTATAKGWLPEPWLINVTRSGDQCLLTDKPMVFWRPDKTREAPIIIYTSGGAWRAQSQWPAGSDKLAPPKPMPITDNSNYRFELGDKETVVTLHLLPQSVANVGTRAAWMQELGCEAQTRALLESTQN